MPKIYPANLILVGLVLLPNILPLVFRPVNIPAECPKSQLWIIVTALEWIGRAAVFILPLFWAMKLDSTGKGIVLSAMILCLVIYYSGWGMYLARGRDYRLLFEPLLFIPVPMAVFPALYFILAGVLLNSWPVSAAAAVFAAGHVLESLRSCNTGN